MQTVCACSGATGWAVVLPFKLGFSGRGNWAVGCLASSGLATNV